MALPTDLRSIDPHAQLLDLDRADCEESLYEFFKSAWHCIDPAPWMDGWCMDAIAEHLQLVCDGEIRRLIINISPRCSKSNLVSVSFPAWVWAQKRIGPISGPGVPFLHASYANQLSLRDSVKCRRLIESPWYQERWGDRYRLTTDQNTKSRFTNDKGGERLITSIDGTNTGEGGMCFVAGTRVSTPAGQRPIEDLRPGDAVYGFDSIQQKVVKSRVLAIKSSISDDIYTIQEASGHRLTCTGDHPIYIPGEGYRAASEMGIGDRLVVARPISATPSWENSHVVGVSKNRSGAVRVYDIQVERTRNLFAESICTSNCIIIDDPNSVDDVDSEATIQTAIDWWTGTMPTRLNNQDTGAYIIIQQRTFENDLTGHILETEGDDWVHLMIPMRYEPERSYVLASGWKDPRTEVGQLMWPERFSEAAVSRLEKRLGPFRAAGQLQQRPEPAGGGIIKRDWWQVWEGAQYPPFDYIMGLLDTAYTEETQNDPSGMLILGVYSDDHMARANRMLDSEGRPVYLDRSYSEGTPKVMMIFAWDDRYELHELVERVAKESIRLKIDTLVIENKASGISVAQEIRRLYANEKFSVQLSDPKSQDKMARLYSVQHLFAEGMIYAPDRPWAERVITQVGQFPKGKHDEYVDLISMGLRKLREMGLLVRPPERQAEIEQSKVYRGQTEPLYPV